MMMWKTIALYSLEVLTVAGVLGLSSAFGTFYALAVSNERKRNTALICFFLFGAVVLLSMIHGFEAATR